MVRGLLTPSTHSRIPPAKRQALTHRVKWEEHGKPNYLRRNMESTPQGMPIGKWVEDVGGSKGQPVTGWIGDYSLTRKGADFRQVLRCEKVGRTILKRESKWGHVSELCALYQNGIWLSVYIAKVIGYSQSLGLLNAKTGFWSAWAVCWETRKLGSEGTEWQQCHSVTRLFGVIPDIQYMVCQRRRQSRNDDPIA